MLKKLILMKKETNKTINSIIFNIALIGLFLIVNACYQYKTNVLNYSYNKNFSRKIGVFNDEYKLLSPIELSKTTSLHFVEAWSENLWYYIDQKGNIKITDNVNIIIRFNSSLLNDSIKFYSTDYNIGILDDKIILPLKEVRNDSIKIQIEINSKNIDAYFIKFIK